MKRLIAATGAMLGAFASVTVAEAHTLDHHSGAEGVLHWLLDHGYIVGVGLACLSALYFVLRRRGAIRNK